MGDGGLLLGVPVLLGGAGAPQDGGDLQQLPGVQAAPHVRPVEAGPHRLHPGEAGAPPLDEHVHCRRGLVQGPLHVVRVGHGPQGQGALLPLLGGGAGGELLQNPGQLQCDDGFFKQVRHSLPISCLSYIRFVSRLFSHTFAVLTRGGAYGMLGLRTPSHLRGGAPRVYSHRPGDLAPPGGL